MGRGLGSEGHLESVEWQRGRSGRCPGGQAEVGEDLGDHGGIFDGGEFDLGQEVLEMFLNHLIEDGVFGTPAFVVYAPCRWRGLNRFAHRP